MKVKVFEAVVGDSVAVQTFEVADAQSIVFLTPSVLNPVLCARFYDKDGQVHQIEAERIVSIDPDRDVRLPVRYLDPETGTEIASLKTQVAELQQRTVGEIRLGPRPETQEDIDRRTAALSDVIKKALKHEHEKDHEGRQICTTSGDAPSQVRAEQTEKTGQHKAYIVLCEEERQKGFVRPYRDAYKHVGRSVCGVVVGTEHGFRTICDETDLTHVGEHGCVTRRVTTEEAKDIEYRRKIGGCGSVTTMGRALSETYARDPKFYGATFCCTCNQHFPVGEFTWSKDGEVVGS